MYVCTVTSTHFISLLLLLLLLWSYDVMSISHCYFSTEIKLVYACHCVIIKTCLLTYFLQSA